MIFRNHFLTHSMKINNSTISLNGLEFKSKIGLFDFEKESGNTFIVNVSIDVDKICLLYTSPSPRDVEESRMPSSA